MNVDSDPTLHRRTFVKKAAALTIVGACAVCGHCDTALADPTSAPAAGETDLGLLSDFSKDGLDDRFAKKYQLILIRADNRLVAASSRCTHKGCAVKVDDQSLKCPCHGSVFTLHGTVDTGPARTSLPRFGIRLSGDKHVLVNKNQRFREKDWDDTAAFIALA
jgi:cytochrome b6-f complex iron-sulfur subunit